jgi:hypothetical protein
MSGIPISLLYNSKAGGWEAVAQIRSESPQERTVMTSKERDESEEILADVKALLEKIQNKLSGMCCTSFTSR